MRNTYKTSLPLLFYLQHVATHNRFPISLGADRIGNIASNSSSIVAYAPCLALALVLLRVYEAFCLAMVVSLVPCSSSQASCDNIKMYVKVIVYVA
jgi:hypothetical protein